MAEKWLEHFARDRLGSLLQVVEVGTVRQRQNGWEGVRLGLQVRAAPVVPGVNEGQQATIGISHDRLCHRPPRNLHLLRLAEDRPLLSGRSLALCLEEQERVKPLHHPHLHPVVDLSQALSLVMAKHQQIPNFQFLLNKLAQQDQARLLHHLVGVLVLKPQVQVKLLHHLVGVQALRPQVQARHLLGGHQHPVLRVTNVNVG